jgi:signal transduction histidine kinase
MTSHTVEAHFARNRDESVTSEQVALKEVAHDMRQPIVTIQALIDSCQAESDLPPSMEWHIEKIAEQATELSALVSSLLNPDLLATTAVAVVDWVADLLDTIGLTFAGCLLLRGETSARLLVDPLVLWRAVANVIVNATRAAGPFGTVEVTVQASAREVCIQVDDDGPGFGGVEPELFLGLRIVKRSMCQAGGGVRLGSAPTLTGARVELWFPRPLAVTPVQGHATTAL